MKKNQYGDFFCVEFFFESGWKILATQKDEHNPLTKISQLVQTMYQPHEFKI